MNDHLRHDFVYYSVSTEDCENYRSARRHVKVTSGSSDLDPTVISGFLTQRGQAGEDVTSEPLQLLNRKLSRYIEEIERTGPKHAGKARQLLDQKAARETYSILEPLPTLILNDHGFWRYAAVHALYDVVDWRYPKDNGTRWGSSPSQQIRNILYAWFVRGQLCRDYSSEQLSIVNRVGDIDIWTSHVIAVLHGSSPTIMYEFLVKCVNWQNGNGGYDDFSRLAFRDLAKQLQALRSNFVFDVIDPVTAKKIVDRLVKVSEENARMHLKTRKSKAAVGPEDED